jgi:uncharacterized protein (TIGR02145 family)
MTLARAAFAVLATISLGFCQSVNISGRVTDTGSAPIAGAIVTLEKGGQTATTGADGSFSLTGIARTIRRGAVALSHSLSVAIHDGVMFVKVTEKSSLSIRTYTLQGKMLADVERTMEPGTHSVDLPRRSTGMYLHTVKSQAGEFVIRDYSSAAALSRGYGTSRSGAAAKRAQKADVLNDVIAVAKSGYLDYRVNVTTSDTSGIGIMMIVCQGTVSDTDGNTYQTVRIGNQVWTTENLRTTKYNDGTGIPHVPLISNWTNLNQPAYVIYNNTSDADSIRRFGVLYNWYVVNTQKLAPTGWHVPTNEEWDTLQNFLIAKGYNWDGTTTDNKIGKALAAKTDWIPSTVDGGIGNNLTTNNTTGFSAVPSGSRYYDVNFNYIGQICYWWTTTAVDAAHADYRMLNTYLDYLDSYLALNSCGFSVRLLKD